MLLLLVSLAAAAPISQRSDLVDAVTAEGSRVHLEALQAIAKQYGSRAIATGYNASAEYVAATLRAQTDFTVYEQYFDVPVYTERSIALRIESPLVIDLFFGSDFGGNPYGGARPTNITADVISVVGCSTDDFMFFPPGAIALMQTGGDCTNFVKAENAELGGAGAAILHAAVGTSGYPRSYIFDWANYPSPNDPKFTATIPIVSVTATIAQVLLGSDSPRVTIQADVDTTIYRTLNVIADTPGGDPNRVVVIGAHLDSVPAGSGLVDNGSGSSAILDIALQYSRLRPSPVNKVRFAWWGAEEIGLQGAYHYLYSLTPAELSTIALNTNLDMTAAPNFVIQAHNGSTAAEPLQPGCILIQSEYEAYYQSVGAAYSLAPLGGGSDYRPFLDFNIPAGGLQTGASAKKTESERIEFGGLANAAYDPCYHLDCDTLENINWTAQELQAKAAAYTLDALADDPELLSKVRR